MAQRALLCDLFGRDRAAMIRPTLPEGASVRGLSIRRRDVLALLGGAAAWPLAARAQPAERVRRVGILMGYADSDPVARARVAAFERALRERGWAEGRNVQFDRHWPADDPDRIRRAAAEIVARSPDAILSSPAQVTLALKHVGHGIPVIFANVPDPVGIGLVASLARPGGNFTGFTNFENELAGKWLDVLREVAPAMRRVAVLYNAENPVWRQRLGVIEDVAPSLGVQVTSSGASSDAEIERAFASFVRDDAGAVLVLPSIFAVRHRQTIIGWAARHRLPAVYPFRFFVADGGLIAYGIDATASYARAPGYVDRILKGEKPADLPVQAPVKFELAVNLKTAKALGLTVPATLIVRADEVIE
jgi:putative ABC transport system substrate-binding protein